MADERPLHPETLALHAGLDAAEAPLTRTVPIYQSAPFLFRSAAHAAALFDLEEEGHIYSRISNPTVKAFEDRMAALEGGVGALAAASGQAAVALTLMTFLRAGDHVVAAQQIYGGTFGLLNATLRRFGVHTWFVDIQDLDAVRDAFTDRTRAIYCELIGNPALNVPDLEALGALAREKGVPFIVDNTVATPLLCRVLDHGADLAVHSATKFIGGHGATIGGVVVDKGSFNWANGAFPEFTLPSPILHGKVPAAFGPRAFLVKAQSEMMFNLGCCLAPFNAFLLSQGLETLPLRMERHSANALAMAEWLLARPEVAWVNYPGLPEHPQAALARKYLPRGQSGLLTFGVKGGLEAGRRFVEGVRLASFLANLGDAKTLVIQPATTTHAQLSPPERLMAGVPDEMIRVSVGLENLDDLQADFARALERSGGSHS